MSDPYSASISVVVGPIDAMTRLSQPLPNRVFEIHFARDLHEMDDLLGCGE